MFTTARRSHAQLHVVHSPLLQSCKTGRSVRKGVLLILQVHDGDQEQDAKLEQLAQLCTATVNTVQEVRRTFSAQPPGS